MLKISLRCRTLKFKKGGKKEKERKLLDKKKKLDFRVLNFEIFKVILCAKSLFSYILFIIIIISKIIFFR